MSTRSHRLIVSSTALLLVFGLSGLTGCGTQELQGDPEAGQPTSASTDGPLVISKIVPTRGLVESNTIVLVEGEGFTPGTLVYFGGLPAKEVYVLTDGMLTAITPVHPIGAVDVRVEAQIQGRPRSVRLERAFDFSLLGDIDPGTDKDGDGLTDLEELAGWDIKVDIFGFGLDPGHFGSFLEHHVDSNPGVGEVDTDGDGLTDLEEFFIKSNPRDPDTDGDGLWDGEEWHRWLTSPISVDTDGDARSADPSSAFSTLPPNASLFDGAELYDFDELAKDPADRGPIKLNATSLRLGHRKFFICKGLRALRRKPRCCVRSGGAAATWQRRRDVKDKLNLEVYHARRSVESTNRRGGLSDAGHFKSSHRAHAPPNAPRYFRSVPCLPVRRARGGAADRLRGYGGRGR